MVVGPTVKESDSLGGGIEVIFHSVTEILESKRLSLEKIRQDIQGLTILQATFHPVQGGWSIAEIAEHLCLVEGQMLKLIPLLLKKTEDAGKSVQRNSPLEVSLQSQEEKSLTEKYVTRDATVPTGKKLISESIQILQDYQNQMLSLQARLESIDLAFAEYAHWIFGSLNLGQWLAFISLHEERHCRQIESILNSPEIPQSARK